jgi:hypothetical protein
MAGILSLASGCATKVNAILADPGKYRDRDVKVTGEVVDSVSLGGRGAYRLDDDTGTLWIVNDSGGGVPRTGAKVSARGRIRDAFNFEVFGGRVRLPGGLSSGLVMLESSHEAD